MATRSRQRIAVGQRRRGNRWSWAAGTILLLPLLVVLSPTVLVLAVAMLPTLTAVLVDRSPEKHLALSVGFLNFCGALPAVADLWFLGQTLAVATNLIQEASVWLAAYGMAALGWLIYMVLPPAAGAYLAKLSESRIRALRRNQQSLVDAWGDEVAAD